MSKVMNEKVVLVGAGSAMFTRGLMADLLRRGWEGEVALVDVDPDALAVARGLCARMIVGAQSGLKLTATTDRRQALPGATVVICTVGVGGRRAWEQDVFVPRKYGIYQPVGDTVMPGGSSRALRMIPPMVDIARDSLELCPAALLFNYGNPMACVCRAIRKATGANVVGLCHGVFDVGRHLAEALDVSPERLRYVAAGMNHLTWFTELRVDGQDAMPRLKQIARERLSRFTPGQFDDSVNPFTWQMVELFGAFPAVLDRHVTEFFGRLFSGRGAYYGKTLGLDAYSFDRTIAWGDRIFAEMREQAGRSAPLGAESLRGEHEQVIDIIESIRTDAGRCYSANLPNRGQAPNLPAEAVLESPAIADGSGLRPVVLPAMASGLAGTLATRLQWVETVVEAALEGSRDKFIQALLLDGAVDSVDVACKLADELLAAQAQYLPQFER